MIYFDNSASTLIKPKNVQRAVANALMYYTANPGRSAHTEAIKTAMEVESVRTKVKKMTNGDNVIFTGGCTVALNTAILGAVHGGHVICTENEHNSVLRPLRHLEKQYGVQFTVARQHKKGVFRFEDFEKYIKDDTRLVICNHISNVNGDTAEVEEIGKKLKERGIIFMVDGAQSGGHIEYDMKKQGIDILAFSPHKGFYAPQGVGCLVFNDNVKIEPIIFGGTGVNSLELENPDIYPEGLEAGTLNTPAILGFGAGIDFVQENFGAIKEKMEDLTTYIHYEFSKLPVKIYTTTENTTGVFAFNIPGIDSMDLCNFLSEKYEICVRGGYQCAPKKHEALGTLDGGCVRVSFSYFNTFQEVEKFIMIIKNILKTNRLVR